jgi:hypothetical protein
MVLWALFAGAIASAAPVNERAAPAAVRFFPDVTAVLTRSGCNQGTCHGNGAGKGGFRLSLRGEDPIFDIDVLSRGFLGRRIDPYNPDNSLILRKVTGGVPHEGGVRFAVGSLEYRVLREWIGGGAAVDPPGVPQLLKITVDPPEWAAIAPNMSVRMRVQAHFSDGSQRDVTRLACYDPSRPVVDVDAEGTLTARNTGEVTLLVRYADQMAVSNLAFLPNRPGYWWKRAPEKNFIDTHVFAKLRRMHLNPSPLCSDAVFIRRLYLDLLGIIPTGAEVRDFLADKGADKREKLIDRLLERPEFIDFWTLKWADVLRADPLMLDPVGAGRFNRWLRRAVAADMPLDRFTRALLTGTGSTYLDPASCYYRIQRTPEDIAENTAQLFLGVRLKCARCHNHPAERWTMADYYGLAAFFARVQRKLYLPQNPQNNVSAVEGEETILIADGGDTTHPRNGSLVRPRVPADPARGTPARVIENEPTDRRTALADWVTAPENPFFARAMANRIWYHLVGRGIVDPIDDMRDSNPPANPALLEALAAELIRNGFRTKPLIRAICASRTYQCSSAPNEENADDESNFSRATARLLSAEQLLDAVCRATAVAERLEGLPPNYTAMQMTGGRTNNAFLKMFGKPARLTVCECERTTDITLAQSFQLISGPFVAGKVSDTGNRAAQLIAAGRSNAEIVEELYLSALSRMPGEQEAAGARAYLDRASDRGKAAEDLLWALINAKEFLLRH